MGAMVAASTDAILIKVAQYGDILLRKNGEQDRGQVMHEN